MSENTRPSIRALDPAIVGMIAAGEVVERPALAIKELIENSIDAGATAITVEIEEGGLRMFRVADNGCGIAPEEVRIAFTRHATSKLRTADELMRIHTLGFRGEALAAIAAVSRVTMITRQPQSDFGVKAVVEGGVFKSVEQAASPEGTSITARDLFFNTPARLKFLKKPATEAGLVSDIVMRVILARPDIAFRFRGDGRSVYTSPGNGSLRDALFSIVGHETMALMTEVSGSAAGCALSGFVGVGEAARSTRAMQTFLLNGRYIKSELLSQALELGAQERVMTGKYPICALHLTMPFEAVDVNVHPNKLSVRFRDEKTLLEGVAGIIRAAFTVEPFRAAPRLFAPEKAERAPLPAPRVTPTVEGEAVSLPPLNSAADEKRGNEPAPRHILPPEDRPFVRLQDGALTPRFQRAEPPFPPPEQFSFPEVVPRKGEALRVLGVAWLEYVFAELGDTLYIIDQHAAHERILYENYQRALSAAEDASQLLLVPLIVQLTHREHGVLMRHTDELSAAGFAIEDFGDRAVQVRAVPMLFGAPQLRDFFGEMADRIAEYRALPTLEKRRDMLVKLACRKAVKAGDPLSTEQIERLIEEMQDTCAPPTCPHGRPIVIRVAKVDLDKRFRRIV